MTTHHPSIDDDDDSRTESLAPSWLLSSGVFFRQTLHHDTEDILQKSNQWCSWSVKWIFSIDYLASMEKSSITSPSLTCTGITDLLSERYVRREFKELLHGKQYVQVMIPQQVSYCNQKLRWKFLEDFRLLPVLSNMFR